MHCSLVSKITHDSIAFGRNRMIILLIEHLFRQSIRNIDLKSDKFEQKKKQKRALLMQNQTKNILVAIDKISLLFTLSSLYSIVFQHTKLILPSMQQNFILLLITLLLSTPFSFAAHCLGNFSNNFLFVSYNYQEELISPIAK